MFLLLQLRNLICIIFLEKGLINYGISIVGLVGESDINSCSQQQSSKYIWADNAIEMAWQIILMNWCIPVRYSYSIFIFHSLFHSLFYTFVLNQFANSRIQFSELIQNITKYLLRLSDELFAVLQLTHH
jgi:hypothetical protein